MANEWGWEMEGWKGWRSVEIKPENEEKRTGKRKILQRDRGVGSLQKDGWIRYTDWSFLAQPKLQV